MISIPNKVTKTFTQTNKSNVLGNIWSSFNLDLTSNLGRLRVSPRIVVSTNTTGDSDMTNYPCAFRNYVNLFWTVAGTKVHTSSTSSLQSSWSVAAGTPTSCDSAYSDMEIYNNLLYVSTKSNSIYRTNGGGTFTAITVGTNGASYPTMFTVYSTFLYAGQTNIIYTIDTADTVVTKLTIGNTADGNQITFLRASSNRIWIGTINRLGGKGYVHEWDGSASQVTRSYRLESSGAVSCVIKDDVPWITDTNGRILVWTGGTFQEVARLPKESGFLTNALSQSNNRFIHPNGMTLIESKINLLFNNLNGDSSATINENLPSGVWEYNETIGLYHKSSLSLADDDDAVTSFTDYGQNRVSAVGALADMKVFDNAASAQGSFLAGATIYTNASSTTSAVFINDLNDTFPKTGYLVTPWIDSQTIDDTWQEVQAFYKKFLTSTDKIIAKYRIVEALPTEVSISWLSTSTFSTTTNILGKETYEVEGIQGTGSGKTAHISRIDVVGSTYTVTLDDTFTGVTGTAKVRIQNWSKMLPEITAPTGEITKLNLGGKSAVRIQIKLYFQFTGKEEFFGANIINKTHQ